MNEVDKKLQEMAFSNITRGTYPSPTPTVDSLIVAKRAEIRAFRSGKVARPSPKSEYLVLLHSLEKVLDQLVAQNETIRANNTAARAAIDNTYNAAIAAYIADPANIAVATREVQIGKLVAKEGAAFILGRLVTASKITEEERTARLSKY